MKEFGRIDILVNNAGVGNTVPIHEQDEASWDKEMDVDLKGPQFLSSAAAKIMTDQKSGNIINIASVAGFSTGFGNAYAVAKAALIRMTRIYAFFMGEHNVRVNCIAPGLIDTEILLNMPAETRAEFFAKIPLGRMGQTSEIASVALFLASDASSFVTGVTIPVDGGMIA
jgi:3-oxoacyl-[acyl-carrier protein] reductase